MVKFGASCISCNCQKVVNMMTSSETDIEKLGDKETSESAVLEISSTATGGNVKQENRDVDYLSNYSTSIEGSVVRT